MWRSLCVFSLLGFALFAVDRLTGTGGADAPVVIPAARVAALRGEMSRAFGREPTDAELERALVPEIDDELLYREAAARGYDRDDPVVFRRLVQNLRFTGADGGRDDAELFREALELGMQYTDVVVRRRMVQRMRLDLEAAGVDEEPDEHALREAYTRERGRYRAAARTRFTQLYFAASSRAVAERLLRALREDDVAPDDAHPRGEPFLYAPEQPSQTHAELAGRFGDAFADEVFAAAPGAWHGPIASAYGVHLVWVREREPERLLGFDAVRDRVRYSVLAERRRAALERALRELRARAIVHVEWPARAR